MSKNESLSMYPRVLSICRKTVLFVTKGLPEPKLYTDKLSLIPYSTKTLQDFVGDRFVRSYSI